MSQPSADKTSQISRSESNRYSATSYEASSILRDRCPRYADQRIPQSRCIYIKDAYKSAG